MREIKLRGYAVEELVGSQWITGYGINEVKYINEESSSIYLITSYGDFKVYEDSVGQYTGMNDINKTKIYGKDIVEIEFDMFFMNFGLNEHIKEHDNKYKFVGEVKFYDGSWYVDNGEEAYYLFREEDQIKVIGNSFQIPNGDTNGK